MAKKQKKPLNTDKPEVKQLLSMKGKASLSFDWEALEDEELKAQAKRKKALGQQ